MLEIKETIDMSHRSVVSILMDDLDTDYKLKPVATVKKCLAFQPQIEQVIAPVHNRRRNMSSPQQAEDHQWKQCVSPK